MVEYMVSLVDVFAFFTHFLQVLSISEQNFITFMVQASQIFTKCPMVLFMFFLIMQVQFFQTKGNKFTHCWLKS